MNDNKEAIELGERLLATAFPSNSLGRGFYTHLDHGPSFAVAPAGTPLHDRMVAALDLAIAVVDGERIFGFDEYGQFGQFNNIGRVTVVSDGSIVVAGFYDGDGHVVAADLATNQWVSNTDMKCPDDWYRIEPVAEDATPDDATPSAVATAEAIASYRKERETLAKLAGSLRGGMPELDAGCETCLDGAIAIIPFCATCKRGPHIDGSYIEGMDPDKTTR